MEALILRGQDAFLRNDFETALKIYTEAIDIDDTRSAFFIARADVYAKIGQYSSAVIDTVSALQLDPNATLAHLRQGEYYWNLKDFVASNAAFQRAKQLGDNSDLLQTWLDKCKAVLGNAADAYVAPSAGHTVEPPLVSVTAPLRIRHDWYQTEKNVVIDIIIKKVKREDVTVEILPGNLVLTIKGLPGGGEYNLDLDLCYEIVPSESKWTTLSTKVEITLRKKSMVRWPALEGTGEDPVNGAVVRMQGADALTVSKKDQTKWDSLAAQVKLEEKDEKLEGDAALNKFFKDLYGDASDETKRAMNKSYMESGGTVLSTNWAEIGAKKTEVKPPTGTEFKKF